MRQDDAQRLFADGFVAHATDFTHDVVGTFAQAMKYVAAIWLANQEASVEAQPPAAETPPM